MTSFDEPSFPVAVRKDIVTALRRSWADIGKAGTWWNGPERVAIAAAARAERLQRSKPPWSRDRSDALPAKLPERALDAARTIAADPNRLDREWAESVIAEIGDAHYVEIASVVATTVAADAFCEALGRRREPFPRPESGEPSRERPEGMGDIGAWVPTQVENWYRANVSRALSLVPEGVRTFFRMVVAMYSGTTTDFGEMVWDHRPLSRPQVELVAARVSALNECFY